MNPGTRRYLDVGYWWLSLSQSWVHVFIGCLLTWIASNGVEATAAACPWHWIRDAFEGTGVSWKSAIVQAIVHATYNALRFIHRTTPSAPPFPIQHLPRRTMGRWK